MEQKKIKWKRDDVLEELEDMREGNQKVYQLKNGTRLMVFSSELLHSRNVKTGRFEEIGGGLRYGEKGLTGKRGACRITLPDGQNNTGKVCMESGAFGIEWEYLGAVCGGAAPTGPAKAFPSPVIDDWHPNPAYLKKSSSSKYGKCVLVRYGHVEDGVDFVYEVKNGALKENIVLYKENTGCAFCFRLRTKGLTPVITEGGRAVEFDTGIEGGKTWFRFPAPFMRDAAGECSEAVFYRLNKMQDGGYDFRIEADADWIQAPERTLPVTIDPYVELGDIGSVPLHYRNTAGGFGGIAVGFRDTLVWGSHLFADLSWIPASVKIRCAVLTLTQQFSTGNADFYWCLNTDRQSIVESPQENGHVFYLDVTDSVERAHADCELGCEFTLGPKTYAIAQNGSFCCGEPGSPCAPCLSCEPSVGKKGAGIEFSGTAELWVQYAEREAYSDHPSLLAVSPSGGPESGYVNLFTGSLFYEKEDIHSGGAAFPFSISHYWNGNREACGGRYGKGWGLSLDQRVEVRSDDAADAYIDGKGRIHHFIQERGHMKDTGGLNLTLVLEETGPVIHDGHGGRMRFDPCGRLSEMEDASGNRVTVERDALGRISVVKDGFGRCAGLYYDESGRLDMIADPAGRMVTYRYDAGDRLAEVKYPDGSTAAYAYDKELRLASVKERDGTRTVYRYSAGGKVIRTEMYASGTGTDTGTAVPQAHWDIAYRSTRSTAVADQTGRQKVYVLDEAGRTVLAYEDMPAGTDGECVHGRFAPAASLYQYTDKTCTFSASLSAAGEEQNRMVNGSFERGEDAWQFVGKRIGTGGDGIVPADSAGGTSAYQILGAAYMDKYIKQKISADRAAPAAGDALIVSAWAKANSAATSESGSTRFELRAQIRYTDGTAEEPRARYDAGYTDWQYAAIPIRISKGKTLSSVTVYLDYSHNKGKCLFRDVRLVDAPSASVLYEEKAGGSAVIFGEVQNIVRRVVMRDGRDTIIQEQNGSGDTVRETEIDSAGNEFVRLCAYDDRHRLILRRDERNRVTEYTYNDKGMRTSVKTYFGDASERDGEACTALPYFKWDIRADETGEFAAEISGAGPGAMRLQSRCHPVKGLLLDTAASNGQTIRFAYDAATDLLASMRASVGSDNYFVLYEHTSGKLSKITRGGFSYGFSYDGMGRLKGVSVAGEPYWEIHDAPCDPAVTTTRYAGGETREVERDRRGRPVRYTYIDRDGVGTVMAEWEYDERGNVVKIHDLSLRRTYAFQYDEFANMTEETIDGVRFKTYEYDGQNRLKKADVHFGGITQRYMLIYEKRPDGAVYPDAAVTGTMLDGVFRQGRRLDAMGRVAETALTLSDSPSPLLAQRYAYADTCTGLEKRLSPMVRQLTRYAGGSVKDTLRYTYDGNGNITAVRSGTEYAAKYTYDSLQQLVREDNAVLGRSYAFTYDTAGNLLTKKEYAYTTGTLDTALDTKTYVYSPSGWRDRLIEFGGAPISYDALGNPVLYRGRALTWGNVRQLLSYRLDADRLLTFAYDAAGVRIRKGETTYENDGNRILRETGPAGTLTFFYGSGGVQGFRHDGGNYFYEKNLQGDVTAIYDEHGGLAAEYVYDAWGNHKIVTDVNGIGTLNPFRYRGYYCDTETGLYSLCGRYYDPETGRFLNADMRLELRSFPGYNAFVYGLNCPVMYRSDGGRPAYAGADGPFTGDWRLPDAASRTFYGFAESYPMLLPAPLSLGPLDWRSQRIGNRA